MKPERYTGMRIEGFVEEAIKKVDSRLETLTVEEQLKEQLKAIEAKRQRARAPQDLLNALVYSRWGGPTGLRVNDLYKPTEKKYRDFYSPPDFNMPLLPFVTEAGVEIPVSVRLGIGLNIKYDRDKRPRHITQVNAQNASLSLQSADPKNGSTGRWIVFGSFEYNQGSGVAGNDAGDYLYGFGFQERSPSGHGHGEVIPIKTDSEMHTFLTDVLSEAIAVNMAERANA